jgi:hypothetical protein
VTPVTVQQASQFAAGHKHQIRAEEVDETGTVLALQLPGTLQLVRIPKHRRWVLASHLRGDPIEPLGGG